jgi:hypothetical protein
MFRACRIAVATLLGWALWNPLSVEAQQAPVFQAPVYQVPTVTEPFPYLGQMATPPGGAWHRNPHAARNPEPFPNLGREPIFGKAYFRAEYLDWNIESPGDVLLGAQIAGVPDPRDLFPVTDVFGTLIGAATVPTTKNLDLDGNNGFRGTIGIEFARGGAFEFGGFVLQKAYAADGEFGLLNRVIAFTPPPTLLVPGPNAPVILPRLIATSTLVNNQVGNNFETYNNSYTAVYASQLASGEASVVWDHFDGNVVTIKAIAGFRFIRLMESLNQEGVFTDVILSQDLVSEIDSSTTNDLYGGMAGFRAEMNWKRLTIGVQPRVGLATVRSNNFRSLADGEHITSTRETLATPMFDLGVYAQFGVTKKLSVNVGYNFLWLGQITRPEDNVFYNSNGPFPTPPDIHVDMKNNSFRLDGVSAGAEYHF